MDKDIIIKVGTYLGPEITTLKDAVLKHLSSKLYDDYNAHTQALAEACSTYLSKLTEITVRNNTVTPNQLRDLLGLTSDYQTLEILGEGKLEDFKDLI